LRNWCSKPGTGESQPSFHLVTSAEPQEGASRTHRCTRPFTACLTYVEGFALSTIGIAYPHAWAVDDVGNVHDSTWPATRGLAYLGIPFSAAYVEAFDRTLGDARLVHDAHLDDYRMLRDDLPDEAVLPLGEPVSAGATSLGRRGGMF
jgi:hypothetical protein